MYVWRALRVPLQFHFINRDAVRDPNAEAAGNLHRRERYNEATVRRSRGILRSRNRRASERTLPADRCIYCCPVAE